LAVAAVTLFTLGRFTFSDPILSTPLVFGLGALSFGLMLRQVLAQRQHAPPPPPTLLTLSRESAREGDSRLRALLSNSSDLILVLSPDGFVRYLSPSVRRVLGFDETAMWAPAFQEFVHVEDMAQLNHLLRTATEENTGASVRGEWRMRENGGSWLHVEGIVTNHLREPGIQGLLLNLRDVTERKVLEAKLLHQARHDSLTGLANRALLLDQTDQALAKARRRGAQIGLLFLDLDDFKHVNDTFGHPEGDKLLQEISLRLLGTCRAADTVARLGGDEFAVLLEESATPDVVERVAERILAQLRCPYAMLRGQFVPTTSIGIAMAHGEMKPQELLRRADVAMYAAKAQGKNRVSHFEPGMDVPLQRRVRLEADLREAVRNRNLSLVYQPIVSLHDGRVIAVEALIRWEHPELGLLYPRDFLPIAEESGLMGAIGSQVLLDACYEVAGLQTSASDPGGIQLCVNLSGAQLRDPKLCEVVRDTLRKTRLAPELLILEVTENALIGDQLTLGERLTELERLGVRVAIDDFGTRYSSLSYLRNLPVHLLKLDRSFVSELLTHEKSHHIVRAVVDLAAALKVGLIAEGIEQSEQRDELLRLGVEVGQGYHFCAPLASYELRRALQGDVSPEATPLDQDPAGLPADDDPQRAAVLLAEIDRHVTPQAVQRNLLRPSAIRAQL